MSKFFENSTVRDVPESHPDFHGSTAERVQLAWMRSGQDACAGSGRTSRHPCGHELCRQKPTGRAGGGGAGENKKRLCEILSLIPVHVQGRFPHPKQFSDGTWVSYSQLKADTIYPEMASGPTGSGLSPTRPPPSSDTSPKFRLFLVLLIHWL